MFKKSVIPLYFYKLRAALLFLFLLIQGPLLFAQQKIKGVILDSNTKQRVAAVYLYNMAREEGTFNNLKGEFHLDAEEGDVLILAKEGYFPDTITVRSQTTLMVELQRSSIWLKEVHIMARKSPQQALEQKKDEYESASRRGDGGPLLTMGNGGAGLSINALYSLISREGRNARYLQEIIERDYRDAIIDYRFSAYLVKTLTGLESDKLEDFMFYYRPSYYFILNSNDYALGIYVKNSFEEYKRNPELRKVQDLAEDLKE